MKRDNIIIAALSIGIVVIIGVTAVVLFQSSKKMTGESTDASSAITITTKDTSATAAATSAAQTAATAVTTASTTVKETVETTPATTLAVSATPSPTPEPALADGSYNAYISAVSTTAPDANSQGSITVRIAKIYTGAEAIAQAKADGNNDLIEVDEDGTEYIPNDYYISDTNAAAVILPVLKSCSIRVIPAEGPVTTSDDYCIDGTLQNLADDSAEYERFATITVFGGYVSFVGEFYLP